MAEVYKLTYIIQKEQNEIRLLGEPFYQRNKLNGYIMYNNQKIPLKEKVETKELKLTKENELKIKIIFTKPIYNKSFMFKDCTLLFSFSQDKINLLESYVYNFENSNSNNLLDDDIYNNIFNDSFEYYSESSIHSKSKSNSKSSTLKNIYNNLNNIKSDAIFLKDMFLRYFSFKLLEHFKIDVDGIYDLREMFYNCKSIKYILDISEWNTHNVFDLSLLFYGCSSLESLPDISKWNTENVTNMNGTFFDFSKLKNLPDISKWKTNNVINLACIFENCSSLESLPDISNRNTENVNNMNVLIFLNGILIM